MKKKRKSSTKDQKTGNGFVGRLFAQTNLPAHVTEEQDWYLDTPDIRLTRVFTIVLILHVVAVGGILAFKMVEKASSPATAAAAAVVSAGDESSSENDATSSQPGEATSAAAVPETNEEVKAEPLLVDHPSAADYQEYRVGSGESLIGIARKLRVSASEIREINHLDSGGNLSVGSWIRVPRSPETPPSAVGAITSSKLPASPPAEVAVATPPPASAPVHAAAPSRPPVRVTKPVATPTVPAKSVTSYQVQKGDTLFGISRRFGIKYQDLMAANGIDKAESLQAGQTLKVPKR